MNSGHVLLQILLLRDFRCVSLEAVRRREQLSSDFSHSPRESLSSNQAGEGARKMNNWWCKMDRFPLVGSWSNCVLYYLEMSLVPIFHPTKRVFASFTSTLSAVSTFRAAFLPGLLVCLLLLLLILSIWILNFQMLLSKGEEFILGIWFQFF